MITVFNQYSALIFILLLAVVLLVVAWRRFPARRGVILPAGILLLLGATLFLFQPEEGRATLSEVEQVLATGNGRPVLIELYSDY